MKWKERRRVEAIPLKNTVEIVINWIIWNIFTMHVMNKKYMSWKFPKLSKEKFYITDIELM